MPLDVFDRILRPLRLGPVTSHYPDAPPDLPPAPAACPSWTRPGATATRPASRLPDRCDPGAPGTWSLDAGACIFCGACARACPTAAIALGGRIELAVDERDWLVIVRSRSGRT